MVDACVGPLLEATDRPLCSRYAVNIASILFLSTETHIHSVFEYKKRILVFVYGMCRAHLMYDGHGDDTQQHISRTAKSNYDMQGM